jgi:hypothetical protein
MQLPRSAMEINVRLVDTAMREEGVGFNLEPGLGMTCQLFPQTIFSFQRPAHQSTGNTTIDDQSHGIHFSERESPVV